MHNRDLRAEGWGPEDCYPEADTSAASDGSPCYLDLDITCGRCGYEWTYHISDTSKEALPTVAACSKCGHSARLQTQDTGR